MKEKIGIAIMNKAKIYLDTKFFMKRADTEFRKGNDKKKEWELHAEVKKKEEGLYIHDRRALNDLIRES